MTKTKRRILIGLALSFLLFAAVLDLKDQSWAKDQTQKQTTAKTRTVQETNQVPAVLDDSTSSQPTSQQPADQQPAKQSRPAPTMAGIGSAAPADPVTLRIASIDLSAPVVKTGLESDGSLHVPSSPDLTGWYDLGPRPGEIGPAVITGHYDSAAGPGVLYNLHKVKTGDEIDVVRNDGSVAVFTVDKTALYPQDNFATLDVYGAIGTAGLRIITCAGTYSKTTKHYSDDLVVYATLKEIKQPGQYDPL